MVPIVELAVAAIVIAGLLLLWASRCLVIETAQDAWITILAILSLTAGLVTLLATAIHLSNA